MLALCEGLGWGDEIITGSFSHDARRRSSGVPSSRRRRITHVRLNVNIPFGTTFGGFKRANLPNDVCSLCEACFTDKRLFRVAVDLLIHSTGASSIGLRYVKYFPTQLSCCQFCVFVSSIEPCFAGKPLPIQPAGWNVKPLPLCHISKREQKNRLLLLTGSISAL